MRRQDLLPIIRKKKTWLALAAAILLLTVSAAWMDKAVADNRAEIDKVYEEMDVHFLLNAGRRNLSAGFTVSRYALRTIEHMDYFYDFGCSEIWYSGSTEPKPMGKRITVYWTYDPEASGIKVLDGELGEGLWLSGKTAEELGLGVGDSLSFYIVTMPGHYSEFPVPVAAIISGSKTYISEDSFDSLYDSFGMSGYYMTDMHFSLKKEYNRKMTKIESELQSLLNTPRPADRNRDVSVNYNAAEVNGMLKPLEKSIESAEFFGKLFRTVLPAVAYAIELIAMIGLRNEIGVRRLLGDSPVSVFFGIWLPVLALCLPGYACSAAVLLFTPLRQCAPWRMMLMHLAGTAVLTAAAAALLCALKPLDLLKENDNEQA